MQELIAKVRCDIEITKKNSFLFVLKIKKSRSHII